jgi:hypothetical protein
MRALVWLTLLAANTAGFFLFTYPALHSRAGLAEREAALAGKIAQKQEELGASEEAYGWIERAGPVLAEIYGREASFLPRLRQTLLSYERGLSLRRSLTEYRPEPAAEAGFPGSRIRVVLEGDFGNLYAYLERAGGVRTALAPTEMSLVEDPAGLSGERLLLTLSFLALWPD